MSRPNVLLITTDQHNAEIMGCAGNRIVQTPNLDRLAREGIIFTSAFTPHPTCTPARTSLFMGQYAKNHKVYNNINVSPLEEHQAKQNYLEEDRVAFPEVLAKAGYHTSLIGKLHTKQNGDMNFGCKMMKLAEGKGQFIRNGSPPDDYRQYLKEKGYGADVWKTWENPEYSEKGCVTFSLPEEDYIDVWTGTEGVKHLEQVEGPFFSWVSFSGPHTPWDPPKPYDTMYDPETIPMPSRRKGELEEKNPVWVDSVARTIPACPSGSMNHSREGGIENAYNRFADSQARRMLAAYYGQITLIDKQAGRLIEVLEKRGILDNTLIVFTADHGDYLGNNWAFFKHAAAYDSLARVPMLMRWPEAIAQGERRDHLVSLVDLAPTILAAAGLAPEEEMDGVALQPLFKDEPVQWRDDLYMEAGLVNTLFTDEWKYLRYSKTGFEELYNRKNDPHDLHNVASEPGNADRCKGMAERLAALLKRDP